MDEVRWEDPPESRNDKGKWKAVLEPLKTHPKRWARIAEYKSSTHAYSIAGNLRRPNYPGRPSGHWEFKTRRVEDGLLAVFARYLGEDGDA